MDGWIEGPILGEEEWMKEGFLEGVMLGGRDGWMIWRERARGSEVGWDREGDKRGMNIPSITIRRTACVMSYYVSIKVILDYVRTCT
jgi:hypothetical protein